VLASLKFTVTNLGKRYYARYVVAGHVRTPPSCRRSRLCDKSMNRP
jgi:hypothetical protein